MEKLSNHEKTFNENEYLQQVYGTYKEYLYRYVMTEKQRWEAEAKDREEEEQKRREAKKLKK